MVRQPLLRLALVDASSEECPALLKLKFGAKLSPELQVHRAALSLALGSA